MDFIFIFLVVIVALAVFVMGNYNSLIRLKNRAQEAWSDIDVQLKRRYDLIPNLVETVKGYANFEQQTLQKVIEARNMAMSAKDVADKAKAEGELSQALKTVFALSESYPDLKAGLNFKHLQEELVDTEDKIQASRRFYNSNVRDLNIAIDVFPANIIANMFGFKKMSLFEITNPAERENVAVKF